MRKISYKQALLEFWGSKPKFDPTKIDMDKLASSNPTVLKVLIDDCKKAVKEGVAITTENITPGLEDSLDYFVYDWNRQAEQKGDDLRVFVLIIRLEKEKVGVYTVIYFYFAQQILYHGQVCIFDPKEKGETKKRLNAANLKKAAKKVNVKALQYKAK